MSTVLPLLAYCGYVSGGGDKWLVITMKGNKLLEISKERIINDDDFCLKKSIATPDQLRLFEDWAQSIVLGITYLVFSP